MTASENIIKGKPTYDTVQGLKKEGKEAEAQAMIDGMKEEEYEQYKAVKKSVRAKSSAEFNALLQANPKQAVKHLRKIEQEDPEEAQRLLDNMDDNEYSLYESGK